MAFLLERRYYWWHVAVCVFSAFDHVFLFQWPILTLGEGLGSREVLFESSSPLSGKVVVEESEDEGVRVRRLIFLCTPHLSQTEVRIFSGKLRIRKVHFC